MLLFIVLETMRIAVQFVEYETRQGRISGKKIEMTPDTVYYALAQRKPGLPMTRKNFAQTRHLVGYYLLEELVLGSEIIVEHGVGHTRRLGYGRRLSACISFLSETPLGGKENQFFGRMLLILWLIHINNFD